jgi:NAD(P)-dependent dehydrogenase (short-subunit alcohol dehydrogenase family)
LVVIPERPVAWVTGANRGMGADTARCLAAAGYDVVLSARDPALLGEVAADVEDRGGGALAVPCDLTDTDAVGRLGEAALERFGRCDVLCNIGIHKGPSLNQLVEETSLDELHRHLAADVVAPFLLCQRALPWMREHGGTIVNMGSSSITLDPPDTAHGSGWSFAYAAAKAALDQLARVLQVEVGPEGVRVFNVEPGYVAYGERYAESRRRYPDMAVSPPEAIGPAIVWLVQSPEADRLRTKRINLPGITHRHGLLPGWDGPGSDYQRPAPGVTPD